MNSKTLPLHNKIFVTLRDRIVFGEYPPGMSLSEKELCEEFKVSRTPLREAFLKLEAMKLVHMIPRFGTNVAPIDIEEMRCAFEVKIRLEGLAGELAAERIDREKLDRLREVIHEAARLLQVGGQDRHRRLIEIEARFHELIRKAANNRVLEEYLNDLHYRCARLWSSSLSEVVPNEEILDQIRKVYDALRGGEGKTARKLMEGHVQYFIDKIKNLLL